MLSSKNEAKQDARFSGRLDVLLERVDMLAGTVATTASALAKKDGEIAALHRALEARDQTLQALVDHANRAAQGPAADTPVDATELRSLRNAVAALTKERAGGVNAAHIESLVTTVRALTERVNALTAAAAAPSTPDPALIERVDAFAAELAVLKTALEHPPQDVVEMISALRDRVEGLATLEPGVTEEQLEERIAATNDALAKASHRLEAIAAELERTRAADDDALARRFEDMDSAVTTMGQRLDALATTVESAASSLGDKEHELASLQRSFTESSTRIESIVDDIREALHAFPGLDATSVDELAARLERLETMARKTSETGVRAAGDLGARIDVIDERLATVADEVSRAKTLWPVALRSLEARLDDVVHARTPEADVTAAPERGSPDVPEDLLAGLRDSLHAMESVAAEMARASEALGDPHDEPVVAEVQDADEPQPSEEPDLPSAAAGVGATIVPLRTGEP